MKQWEIISFLSFLGEYLEEQGKYEQTMQLRQLNDIAIKSSSYTSSSPKCQIMNLKIYPFDKVEKEVNRFFEKSETGKGFLKDQRLFLDDVEKENHYDSSIVKKILHNLLKGENSDDFSKNNNTIQENYGLCITRIKHLILTYYIKKLREKQEEFDKTISYFNSRIKSHMKVIKMKGSKETVTGKFIDPGCYFNDTIKTVFKIFIRSENLSLSHQDKLLFLCDLLEAYESKLSSIYDLKERLLASSNPSSPLAKIDDKKRTAIADRIEAIITKLLEDAKNKVTYFFSVQAYASNCTISEIISRIWEDEDKCLNNEDKLHFINAVDKHRFKILSSDGKFIENLKTIPVEDVCPNKRRLINNSIDSAIINLLQNKKKKFAKDRKSNGHCPVAAAIGLLMENKNLHLSYETKLYFISAVNYLPIISLKALKYMLNIDFSNLNWCDFSDFEEKLNLSLYLFYKPDYRLKVPFLGSALRFFRCLKNIPYEKRLVMAEEVTDTKIETKFLFLVAGYLSEKSVNYVPRDIINCIVKLLINPGITPIIIPAIKKNGIIYSSEEGPDRPGIFLRREHPKRNKKVLLIKNVHEVPSFVSLTLDR